MNSTIFTLEYSEEMKLEDLHLTNKEKVQSTPSIQKIYVGSLQQIKKPFLEQIKPYIQSFLSGAAATAGQASNYGMKALSSLGGVFWWSYNGIKGLFNKTAQYIQPKFVLITSKLAMNNSQKQNIAEKVSKDVAILGLDQYKELSPVENGKFQVAIPVDQEFIKYLRKENYEVKKVEWEPNLEPTKTMIVPSQSFSMVFEELKESKVPMKINNYGGFCTFELQGKNEIEYEVIRKLKLNNEHLEGYLMPTSSKVESIKTQSSGPSQNETPLLVEQTKVRDISQKQDIPKVKSIEGVPLIQEYQLSSDTIKLDYV